MKLMSLAIASLCLATSARVFAVDYDYESARRAWQAEDQQLDRAEVDLQREVSSLRPLEQRLQTATSRLDSVTVELRNLRDRQVRLEQDVSAERDKIDRLTQERENLRTQQAAANDDLRDAQIDLRTLTQENTRDVNRRGVVDRRIQELQASQPDSPQLPGLIDERNDLDRQIANRQRELTRLANQVNAYQSRVDRIVDQLDINARNKTAAQQRAQSLQQDVVNIRSQVSNKERDVEQARDDKEAARTQRDRQQLVVDRAQSNRDQAYREERTAYNYYQQVLANYQRAYDAAVARGRSDATTHGDHEASDRGRPTGTTDGVAAGTTAGSASGLQASQGVAQAQGYNYGLRSGDADTQLAAAFASGKADGAALAQRKAQAEDFPRAYNTRLNELFAQAPSSAETHDISTQLPAIPGAVGPLQAATPQAIGSVGAPAYSNRSEPAVVVPGAGSPSVSTPGVDRRYYAPNCSGQPLNDFTQACEQSYAQTYPSAYTDAYRRYYQTAYAAAFQPAATSAYNTARQTSQPTIYAQAAAAGAHDLGVLRGFSTELPLARTAAVAAGRAAVETLRRQGFMPLLRSVTLDQNVEDGNYSPGEAVKVQVVIDNYGLKNAAQEQLQIKLSDLENATFTVLLRKLPALSADTRVTLVGVLTGAAAAAGKDLKLKAVLEEIQVDGSTVEIDEATFQAGVRHPLELSQVTFPSPMAVGVAANATFVLKNNTTNMIPAVQLPLSINGEAVTTTETSVSVPDLDDGDTASVIVPVTPTTFASTSVPVGFVLDTPGIAGSTPQKMTKFVGVAVQRTGQLDVCVPTCGSVLQLPLHVRAGGTLSLPSQFRFTATQRAVFEFGRLAVSDTRITSANNTTVRVGPGEWGPGSSPYPVMFGYVIPAALRGQTHWVSLYLKQGSTTIQTLRIPFVVD